MLAPALSVNGAGIPKHSEVMMVGMSGLGETGVHQVKMIEWWSWREWNPIPYRGEMRPETPNCVELCRPVDCYDPAETTSLCLRVQRGGAQDHEYG